MLSSFLASFTNATVRFLSRPPLLSFILLTLESAISLDMSLFFILRLFVCELVLKYTQSDIVDVSLQECFSHLVILCYILFSILLTGLSYCHICDCDGILFQRHWFKMLSGFWVFNSPYIQKDSLLLQNPILNPFLEIREF